MSHQDSLVWEVTGPWSTVLIRAFVIGEFRAERTVGGWGLGGGGHWDVAWKGVCLSPGLCFFAAVT